ncbi:19450_t:CDS:2 [Funneliformis geosporum]|nr:19450_t:CDS:2 [Funneliformis geosporum]
MKRCLINTIFTLLFSPILLILQFIRLCYNYNTSKESFTLTSEVPDFFQGLEEQWAETKEKNEEANKQTKKKTKEWF